MRSTKHCGHSSRKGRRALAAARTKAKKKQMLKALQKELP